MKIGDSVKLIVNLQTQEYYSKKRINIPNGSVGIIRNIIPDVPTKGQPRNNLTTTRFGGEVYIVKFSNFGVVSLKRNEFELINLKEDHGMGYSHNVSVPGDENTMNKPTIGPLYEYEKPETRKMAVQSGDTDRSLKMIFQWTRMGQISYEEYEDLLVELFHKVSSKIK